MSVAAKRIAPDDRPSAGNVVPLPEPQASGASSLDARQDAAWLARIRDGDKAAFAALMQQHLSAVLATARRILRDEAEAEDIAQEAFLRLWNSAASLEVGAHGLRPWLRRVASNLAIDGLRKAKRLDVTDDVPEQSDRAVQFDVLEASETAARVEQALQSLPPRQCIAVSLFHFDELSQREVAEIMEISEDALESLLARGRRRLRDILKEDWQDLLIRSNGYM